jgi:hypothetical protein
VGGAGPRSLLYHAKPQRRKGRRGAFPPMSCWSRRRAEHNSVQHPSCQTDRRVERQNQIPPKTPSLQRRLEPIASRRIAPRWTDRRDRPQPALGRRKKGFTQRRNRAARARTDRRPCNDAGGSRVTASGKVTVWFTQKREEEKDNFLLFFCAALRLCVIKFRDNKCARRMRGGAPFRCVLVAPA